MPGFNSGQDAVVQSLKAVKATFSLRHQVANATLNFAKTPNPLMLEAIDRLFASANHGRPKRVSQLVAHQDCKVFMKIQHIETLPKKLRIMLGRRKRSGRFDWPVEELLNTVIAAERGIGSARVIGFGMVKPRLGVIREFVLLTEFLDGHLNGLQWLEKHPEGADQFVKKCMDVIVGMNRSGFTHLDLWIANIMVPDEHEKALRIIDMENVFTRESAFHSETLGFQLGFLYRKDLHRYMCESRYDSMVSEFLREQADVDEAAFERIYTPSKQQKFSHRTRRKIFLQGKLELN
jgi:hypothetical protein